MFQITIPKPCNENWLKMTPTTKGAFCQSCAKEVIDFTKMTDDEVQLYFLNRSGESLCGRFKKEQVHRIKIELPENILYKKMASWKKFLAIILLAFGSVLFGCDVHTTEHTTGVVLSTIPPNFTTKENNICSLPMGAPALIQPDSLDDIHSREKTIEGEIELQPITIKDSIKTIPSSEIFTGDIGIVPIDSSKAKPIPDSSNQLNTKPKIDTLITE